MEWYEKNKNKHFDFHTELLSYCRSYVNILLNACWKFQSLVMHVMGLTNPIDPFNYTTIASVCMGIFCRKFLREEWRVLLCADAKTSCQHEWSCSCKWCKAIKHHGNSSLMIQIDDKNWVGEESLDVVAKKFHSSPVALIPPHGYAQRDNHSKEAMEWILWFQHTYHENVVMRHARSANGKKRIWYDVKAAGKQLFYAVDGYFVDSKGVEHVL